MSEKKLFGTDGIRDVANSGLTIEIAAALGRAVVHFLSKEGTRSRFLLVRDTRRSGHMLEAALIAGITSQGGDVVVAGIVPTPGAAVLIRDMGLDGGIVISASHNPPEFNGLKVIDRNGGKLSDEVEIQFEDYMLNQVWEDEETLEGSDVGMVSYLDDGAKLYSQKVASIFPPNSLSGLKVAIDIGHGAACVSTPEAFRALGAEITVLNDDFSGDDINVDSGSTNLTALTELMKTGDYHIGFAHDGDADRLLAVDADGNEVDGDAIIAVCAKALKEKGLLRHNMVVVTVMSNIGLERALEKEGIETIKTNVGDRYVLEEMHARGASLGGEQSGHIIFLDYNTTGDGLLTALFLAAQVAETGKSLAELASFMKKYPQVMVNVHVEDKSIVTKNALVVGAIVRAHDTLGEHGRVLVRPSGTEPLVRVMAEALTEEAAHEVVNSIVDAISQAIEEDEEA